MLSEMLRALATLLSEVESSVIFLVKFGQAQNCRALSSVRMCSWSSFPGYFLHNLTMKAVHEGLFVNFLISLSVRTGNRREECSIGVQSPFEGD